MQQSTESDRPTNQQPMDSNSKIQKPEMYTPNNKIPFDKIPKSESYKNQRPKRNELKAKSNNLSRQIEADDELRSEDCKTQEKNQENNIQGRSVIQYIFIGQNRFTEI
jgi:hypothetical protein